MKNLVTALSADPRVSNARILTPPTSPPSVHTLLNDDLSFNYHSEGDVEAEVIDLVIDSLLGLGYTRVHTTRSSQPVSPTILTDIFEKPDSRITVSIIHAEPSEGLVAIHIVHQAG